ncbi:NYN domain-containing protein [Neisseria montereyensis]|uniref:NYN domain-containing protein n=1 Tax=Neisseria montereyensis TaxID=2973938 RepID=A0ABT2FEE6_9NEIS|nr:NYN domain-containing protein [Neisseria montereyensis]MCS4534591.1 NYN domain-containing protein [Neisseria montereyensis]
MRTAILIDGAFFIKRIRHFEKHNAYNAQRISDLAFDLSLLHLSQKINGTKQHDSLYRIFFYDCAPLEKKMHNPISNLSIDFSRSDEAVFRRELHKELIKKRKLALRLGKLSDQLAHWRLKPDIMSRLLKGQIERSDITENDVVINVKQKGVDMRIALDIASITLKKQADRIVLISGDSDFVPAAKLARREGIDFILDPMWQNIPEDLFEHIDGLKSTYIRP